MTKRSLQIRILPETIKAEPAQGSPGRGVKASKKRSLRKKMQSK